jgi:xanthine dehydrogenase accessory factor
VISPAQSRRLEELKAAHVPFVTATVVRVQHPTSAEAGSVAIVLADGSVEGFVGGVCAEHSVRAYSMVALANDEPVLLRILPDPVEGEVPPEGAEISSEDGVVTVKNPCLSGGAIEVFLEPAPPAPRVLVVGETPVAMAVHRIGAELDLEMVAYDAEDVAPASGDLALVVAAHGRDELHALRLGLEAGVPYVGLVASERRGAGVIEELSADGVPAEQLERIDVPAGIPIGSHSAGEIALSILAGVVAVRRGQSGATAEAGPPAAARAARAPAASSAALAVDPICGMTVAAVATTPSLEHEGETVYFCCEGCRTKFEARIEHASVPG